MFKRLLTCFLAFLLVVIPVEVAAEELEGTVTSIAQGDPAPFSGILLDSIAASKMIVDKKYLKSEIELDLRKEFQQELSNKRLAFDLLKVEHDSLKKIHEETILLRDQQINNLNELLREEMSDDYTEWWVIGGVALGIALSVITFYASVEVAK